MHMHSPSTGRTAVSAAKDKQRGASAIELVVYLFVAMLILIAAMVWFNKLTTNANNQGELENITSLLASTRTLKTSSGYGASNTDLLPVLIKGEAVPDSMQKSGNAVFNVWGGAVTVVSTGTGYTLTYAGVPASNCTFLAAKSPKSSASSLSINGGTASTGEVTATAADTACSTDSNTLAWSGR